MAKRIRLLWIGLVAAATAAILFGTPAMVVAIDVNKVAGGPVFSALAP